MSLLVDVHCHLDLLTNPEAAVKRAEKAGVRKIITNGVNVESNRKVLELAGKHEIVEAALGVYPLEALEMGNDALERELAFIEKNVKRIKAIGEVGLEFRKGGKRKSQKEIFLRFIRLAEKTRLPLIVHSRGAEHDVVELLASSKAKVVLHCFHGSEMAMRKAADSGFYFSVPTSIVRSPVLQAIVKTVSLSQLLTETDSPFLSPFEGKPNEPAFVSESVRKIAEIKGITPEEAEKIIFMNYQKVFG